MPHDYVRILRSTTSGRRMQSHRRGILMFCDHAALRWGSPFCQFAGISLYVGIRHMIRLTAGARMAQEYCRSIARTAVAQLTSQAGYERIQVLAASLSATG